ncbi:type I toxin-antitoxin system Ibs family toxin, partial [Shigella flexneri]|nr:type I toxin-antitoxin system Ibs family toxin [Shigella flexneri]EIH3920171.1 type I toxin-antitoxin system Ibs family toxin [Escherichia coli]HBA9944787.1 type I toxin-antitoxin system Ibs family toxin [Escherichia coli]HCP4058581.1 type I toxin-antitoxin system Ibs family toxin [Escherichia coli]HCP4246695.1 type I toxin-antitoxin system Ibs family toxin [Escherichia coli]
MMKLVIILIVLLLVSFA